jgi:osmotically-inducible protein OsmY
VTKAKTSGMARDIIIAMDIMALFSKLNEHRRIASNLQLSLNIGPTPQHCSESNDVDRPKFIASTIVSSAVDHMLAQLTQVKPHPGLGVRKRVKVGPPKPKEDLMQDQDLRQRIIDELEFQPSINAANIGVAVEKGIATLTGHVASFAEKYDAEHAVRRVKGVRGIAEEIEVRYPNEKKTADDQIAARALSIIAWDTTIPADAVQVKVQKGWITLTGTVHWHFQKAAAEDAVRKLSGVVGVTNLIEVKAAVQADDVKKRIENALKRNAEIEAGGIQIKVTDNKVVLDGHVNSWHERTQVERAAWSVPGVTSVEDHLAIH